MINKADVINFNTLQTPKTMHQERVNVEMFKALEQLGRKVESAESERERLARRLALLESGASIDEKTGKLYLPVAIDQLPQLTENEPSRWVAAASLVSSLIALCTLGVVLMREPAPVLTQEQIAALNALSSMSLTELDHKNWKSVEPETAQTAAPETARVFAPGAAEAPPETTPSVAAVETAPPAAADVVIPGEDTAETPVVSEVPAPVTAAVPAPETTVVQEQPSVETATAEEPSQPVEIAKPQATVEEKKAVSVESVKVAKIEKAEKPITPKITSAPVLSVTENQGQDIKGKTEPKLSAKPLIDQESLEDIPADLTLPEKFTQLEKNAFEGSAEAQHDLATIYAAGKDVTLDYKRAVYWFARAAAGGVANAYYNLGVMFQQGLGVRKDIKKALEWYEQAASMGHPEAMYNLGIAYIQGVGTSRDVKRGVSFFKDAANAGVAQAAFNLGVLYESNFVGSADPKEALKWYKAAAEKGHAEAQSAVSRLQPAAVSDVKPAVKKKKKAAEQDQGLALSEMVEPSDVQEFNEGSLSSQDSVQDSIIEKQLPDFRDEIISKIQTILAGQGYLPESEHSGLMTQQTEDAIRAWQAKAGLTVDGAPSQALLDAMQASSANQ